MPVKFVPFRLGSESIGIFVEPLAPARFCNCGCRAVSATAETLIPRSRADSSVAASRVSDVLRLEAMVMGDTLECTAIIYRTCSRIKHRRMPTPHRPTQFGHPLKKLLVNFRGWLDVPIFREVEIKMKANMGVEAALALNAQADVRNAGF